TWFGNVVIDADAGRARARLERLATAWGMPPEQMAVRALAGTPDQVIDRIHAYRDAGVTGFIGMYGRVEDLRSTRLVAERVLVAFRWAVGCARGARPLAAGSAWSTSRYGPPWSR